MLTFLLGAAVTLAAMAAVLRATRARRATHCRCGHPRASHEHYSGLAYCGACGHRKCPRFRPEWQVDAALRLANGGPQPPAPSQPTPRPAPGPPTPAGCTWCGWHRVHVMDYSGWMWRLERCPAHEDKERQP